MTILLLSNNLALAANIDFNALNNSLEDCDCINQNESSPQCEPVKSEHASKNNGVNDAKPCKNVKTEKTYVEPKFSTARPRGQ